MEFKPRFTAPSKDDYHYYTNNVFYRSGYGLPNCTCYAWGRFYELLEELGISGTPRLQTSNAENWYQEERTYNKGMEPKLGAVAVWSQGAIHEPSDGVGHVAVVEEIKEDGSFVTSDSVYNGELFRLKTYSKDGYKPGFHFDGFIYLPKDFDTATDKPNNEEPKEEPTEDEINKLKNENEELKKQIEELKNYKFTYNALEDANYQIKLNKGETLYIK